MYVGFLKWLPIQSITKSLQRHKRLQSMLLSCYLIDIGHLKKISIFLIKRYNFFSFVPAT